MPNISIIGASSHIARGLLHKFSDDGDFCLHAYTRSPDKLRQFGKTVKIHTNYNDLYEYEQTAVINCVGIGTFSKINGELYNYFSVNEKFDNLCLDLVEKSKNTLYLAFSSGILGGAVLKSPVQEKDYYSLVKLNSETKHRAFKHFNIVDFRIFSYFSRWDDLTDDYMLSCIINCVKNGVVFVTDDQNIVRDYVGPENVYRCVRSVLQEPQNNWFEIGSTQPVTKFQLIEFFHQNYGLKFEVTTSPVVNTSTGIKMMYTPQGKYLIPPTTSSIAMIQDEVWRLFHI